MRSGLGPGRPHILPLVGGLCLAQRTLATEGLKKLPLVGGLCLVQQTLTTKGLKDLLLVGGLYLTQRTSTTRASEIAPHRRTLSHTADFDHERPTIMQISLKDK
jgi:hypothetical protein